MREINEVAAGEVASHRAARLYDALRTVRTNGYEMQTRAQFDEHADEISIVRAFGRTGKWVLWDPNEPHDRGILLIGDDWEDLFAQFMVERGDWIEGGKLAAVSC